MLSKFKDNARIFRLPPSQKMKLHIPGSRVVIRDEEWLVRRADPSADGGQLLTVDGISDLVRGRSSLFLLDDLFGVRFSTGTVQNWISHLAPKLKPAIEQVMQAILLTPVVHFVRPACMSDVVGNGCIAHQPPVVRYIVHVKQGKEALDCCGILPS